MDLVCRDDGHFLPGRRWLVEVEVGCSFFFLGGDSWSRLLRLRSQLLQEGERERHTHTQLCEISNTSETEANRYMQFRLDRLDQIDQTDRQTHY